MELAAEQIRRALDVHVERLGQLGSHRGHGRIRGLVCLLGHIGPLGAFVGVGAYLSVGPPPVEVAFDGLVRLLSVSRRNSAGSAAAPAGSCAGDEDETWTWAVWRLCLWRRSASSR